MAQGLPVSRLVGTDVNLAPPAAAFLNFDTLIIIGDSDVIDVQERIRSYPGATEIAADFGTIAPEYLAANLFFSQGPKPTQVYVGRWAQSATHGHLRGGALSIAQQNISLWNAITAGGFRIQVDGGTLTSITGLDFSTQTNLNGVASVINTALTGASVAASAVWNGSRFVLTSNSTGITSIVAPLQSAASGTDISAMLGGTAGTGAVQVNGIAAESAAAAIALLDNMQTYWYGAMFASTHITDSDRQAVAAYIEGATLPHLYGYTSAAAGATDITVTNDIFSNLKALGYRRSFGQYSTTNPYSVASAFGREFTVDWSGENTAITLMYKNEPGVAPEPLSMTQANTLDAKNANYFVAYNNGAQILEPGIMAGGYYMDEIHGADAYANAIQTELFRILQQSGKVAQTDPGIHVLANGVEHVSDQWQRNGYGAPGIWDAQGFGALNQGDYMSKGYYVYIPPVRTQLASDRQARKSPPIQVAFKLAGAVHTVNVTVNINR